MYTATQRVIGSAVAAFDATMWSEVAVNGNVAINLDKGLYILTGVWMECTASICRHVEHDIPVSQCLRVHRGVARAGVVERSAHLRLIARS